MDDKKIVGLAINQEFARWAYRETYPPDAYKKPEALDDLVVIDASYGNFAGLVASSLLAEMGAEVIRIEPPGGDLARKMSPYGIMIGDSGLAYIVEARNKFHITFQDNSIKAKLSSAGFTRRLICKNRWNCTSPIRTISASG